MNVLLDTQCWLWWLTDLERLNEAARNLIRDRGNTIFLSAASSWEIAIKASLGKLRLAEPPADYVPKRLTSEGFVALPIEHVHALRVAELPHHHRDPFDRLLVAQCQIENLILLTADKRITDYDVRIAWAGA
ncbi:MAG TPA: type II toxin-antitoxin system VapC family toxin [Acidobacteriota bacterium]|nr:type II toxin-antitoxin system VapC family toxin [Acidobacteriota bacterium]